VRHLAAFLFENSPFDEFWSAFFVGFCVIGADGIVCLTASGQEYLESLK
jgi:hypothetical protein